MQIRKHIPNTITCLSLVSGCIAIVLALQGDILPAMIFIIIAAVLDFLDGLAARLLHAYSDIGKDLDSLADVVSFGVAPGMLLYHLILKGCHYLPPGVIPEELISVIPCIAFAIPALSALRLAKFNNDPRQSESFIGLPVPAHALLWVSAAPSLNICLQAYPLPTIIGMSIFSVLTSLLLISEIPMFSLKVKSLKWKGNEIRYLLLIAALAFIIFYQFLGITFTIILYILLSIFNKKR